MIYVFGDFELDPQRYELRQANVLCAIDPQSFNVLLYLVEHRDRVISKDELFEQLWPQQSVSESTLTQRLRTVRQALGDSGSTQHTIKTTHGRGYRFVAAVEERSGEEVQAPPVDPVTRSCPACQQANASEARFCNACGAALGRVCPACAWENVSTAQFCNACGGPLETATPAPVDTQTEATEPPQETRPLAEGERRQLTVVFCDVVDSTALAQRYDPEDWQDILRVYHQHSAAIMQRHEGHIAQYLGDGLLIYFGYPQAHEDDAARAVRASLELLDALASVNAELTQTYGVDLAIRIGIHTGLVVVGDMGTPERQERLALGETPTIAFRHQELAAPNTVVISASTHRLVTGYFTCNALAPQTLKGYAHPQTFYQVLGVSQAQSRLDVATLSGLTPLTGRSREFDLVRERWEQARDGMGQIVVLSGEAGIGKSRLIHSLKTHIADEAKHEFEGRCAIDQQGTALYPIAALLQEIFQWRETDAPGIKRAKLEDALRRAQLRVEESAPLVAAFVSLPLPDGAYSPLQMEPEQQKQRFFAIVAELLRAMAAERPALVIVEDVHWADPSTLDLVDMLMAQTPTIPMLLVMTCRSEFQLPWTMRSSLTYLTLTRLSREHIASMVAHLTGGKEVPDELLDHLIRQTDGVPLFIEELTKTVLESEVLVETDEGYTLSQPISALSIPMTLHDALMARLDRLGAAKAIAQLGAVIGREFPYDLLEMTSQQDATALQSGLAALVESELLYQQGLPPLSTYQFKHALIQDAAYQSLLRRTRRQLHQHLVEVIEAHFPELAESQPEALARHATAADLPESAVRYWQQAGEQAKTRSAYVEAIAHFNNGLEALAPLPETTLRLEQELTLQLALATALQATGGIRARGLEPVYSRARELCQQLGDTRQLFPVLMGLWFCNHHHHSQTAQELAGELVDLAQHWNDPALLLQAHHISWTTTYYRGDWTAHQHHVEQGLSLYTPRDHHTYAAHYDHDPGVCRLSMSSHALWVLGYLDQAVARSQEALRLAQDLSHPQSHVLAFLYASELHLWRGDARTGKELADAALTLSTAHELEAYRAWANVLQGVSLALQERHTAGLTQQQHGQLARGAINRIAFQARLAETYGAMGQVNAGLEVVAEALDRTFDLGYHYWDAELYRIQGDLLLLSPGDRSAESEACFKQALTIARRQQAKSLELRAATSRARLWRSQGKSQEAYELLAPVYEWFTEGFDTNDLQQAKRFLDALRMDIGPLAS